MTKRVVLLSGGCALGAYQVGPVQKIFAEMAADEEQELAVVAGISVGAVNGVLVAMERPSTLERIWLQEVDGVGYFMRLQLFKFLFPSERGAGLYNLEPLRQNIRRHIDPEKLGRLYAGVCDFDSDRYRSLCVGEMNDKSSMIDVLVASSCQPVIMGGQPLTLDGQTHVCFDGGLREAFPPLDLQRWQLDPTDDVIVDVVLAKSVNRQHPWERNQRIGLLDVAARGLSTYDDVVVASSVLRLAQTIPESWKVNVWAPARDDSAAFDASSETLSRRVALSHQIAPQSLSGAVVDTLLTAGQARLAQLALDNGILREDEVDPLALDRLQQHHRRVAS